MAKLKRQKSKTMRVLNRDSNRANQNAGTRFPLSSEDCELLCELQSKSSLRALSQVLRKDVSVLSRQLAAIAVKAPVLEKIQGRWTLTALGVEVVQWAKGSIQDLERVFQRKSVLKIATTREFGARVMAPELSRIAALYKGAPLIHLITTDDSVERLILSGEVDCGIDCGRPRDPLVAFRLAMKEEFAIYAAPTLFVAKLKRDEKKRILPMTVDELLEHPNLQYTRMPTAKYLALEKEVPLVAANFNDLASLREAAVHGLGWALLPRYVVTREVETKKLIALDLKPIPADQFGVWWLRSRPKSEEMAAPLLKWLWDLGRR